VKGIKSAWMSHLLSKRVTGKKQPNLHLPENL
jgi:hypothetical protein